MKRTLYLAHQSNKLRQEVECHTIQAEKLSYLSSHQTLTADKNWQSYQSPMKLVKKLALTSTNSC